MEREKSAGGRMTVNFTETRMEAEDAKKALWGLVIDRWVEEGIENHHVDSGKICNTPDCNRPKSETAKFCLTCRIEKDRGRRSVRSGAPGAESNTESPWPPLR